MRYTYIIFALFFTLLQFSCSKGDGFVQDDEDLAIDLTWEEPSIEELPEGTYATIKGFECGDEITRTTWIFNSQKLVFGWNKGDGVGIFPTAKVALPATEAEWPNTNPTLVRPIEGNQATIHPEYSPENMMCYTIPSRVQPTPFYVSDSNNTSQSAQLFGNMGEYIWDDQVKWTAFSPYKLIRTYGSEPLYDEMTFVFESDDFVQKQNGIPDISAYQKGTTGQSAGASNPTYVRTEAEACKHLGEMDVLFSSEMVWNNSRINFQIRHVGAVARFYLAAPKNENLVVTNLKLICDKKIFYKAGKFTMKSHPYIDNEAKNYGVNLVGDADSQITPDETTLTNMLQMDFVDGTAVTEYDASNAFKRYVTAYMMMYPITYNSTTDGNLYAYVTAYRKDDPLKKEIHFVSKALENKTMVSGKYYQWTASTKLQDGLYPIELTATLLPWQDIVGGNINADLTK